MAQYDTVIVGAGSAGCVLAARLGEDAGRRLLVIEAGGEDRNPLFHIPLGVGKVWNNPRYNWDYHGEPEPHVDNRSLYHPRGKVLGGSSSINMMAYVRGHRSDYDRLGEAGLNGWSYAEALPYFKRAESYAGGADAYRGGSGPLKTRKNPAGDQVFEAFMRAAPEFGYQVNEDHNGAEQEGFSKTQHTIGEGRRCSAAVAYLHPALKRNKNIALHTRALATRVMLQDARAVGVEYVQNGLRREARATEVLLCGGAYNSPQLLLLSGIGPAGELPDGLAPSVDLPGVGKNLWDHPALALLYSRRTPSPFVDNLRLDRLALAILRAYFMRSGFATRMPANGIAFIRSTPQVAAPDIQLYCGSGSHLSREWFPGLRQRGPDVISLFYTLVRQESRGAVTLASADPTAKPRIFNNFLSTGYDRQALREGFRFCSALTSSAPFAGLTGPRLLPGPEVQSDAQIDAYVRSALMTVYHPAGTCKMGSDAMAVVDAQFRVRGVEGLRVIDASILPDPISCNLNASVIMIAEKAADMVRGRPPLAAANV